MDTIDSLNHLPNSDIIRFSQPEILPSVTSLNDYVFVKILGMGSYGLVCQYKRDDVDYALKFVLSNSTDHETIQHEIEVLYWLNSYDISIPKIYTHGAVWGYDVAMSIPDLPIDHKIRSPRGTQHIVDPFQEYYVMVLEFIDGMDLSSYVKEYPIDDQSSYNISHWLYGLLAFLHEHGIVHRDIKPGNIVITAAKALYLVDFGFACSYQHQQLKCAEYQVGTPVALAPEIWNGKINARTLKKADVWAAGVTIYYVLNQDYPWRVDAEYQDKQEYRQLLKEKILTSPAPDGRYIHPVTDVMKRSLTKDHLLRPSADRLCNYLALYPVKEGGG